MLGRYVLLDLIRNPRRTLSTAMGVALGVGLFCGVLFFVDGLSASMTQRAVAPLAIDMQRIVTERTANSVTMTQTFDDTSLATAERTRVRLTLRNLGSFQAHDVTVRSTPGSGLAYVARSATVDGKPIADAADNPFSDAVTHAGLNLGPMPAGATVELQYSVEATRATRLDDTMIESAYSSRESVDLVDANQSPVVPLADLARQIADLPGIAHAAELSIGNLADQALQAGDTRAAGVAKIFGFDAATASRDGAVRMVAGSLTNDGAVVSAEAAHALHVDVGDAVQVRLPDDSVLRLRVSGIADLSQARSLFSSRRGGDLETFIYIQNSVIVSPKVFADRVFPAFERASVAGTGRIKSPPIREVDITLDRALLASDPATAAVQTTRIAEAVRAVASDQDYLLDNISNTLHVAADDAGVAKKLFVFLGLPGAFLAAMLAAYSGNVLADAQRREHATLRIRGASRRHLLRMLAARTILLTASGALLGLVAGYVAAAVVLGRQSLDRAGTRNLLASAAIGTLAGLLTTGLALYATGRRALDREINEDRARLNTRAPVWRRWRLDLVGFGVIGVGTFAAVRARAFDGASGSVYFGRSVRLNLALLVLPLAVWITGSLVAARITGGALARSQPPSTGSIGRVVPTLFRRSIGRRPWAIGTGAIVASLIVALTTTLATFTASYDAAKVRDARYANGADIRITPTPSASRTYTASDANVFDTAGVGTATPVVYELSNVILRSDRTSDPANLAAIDPTSYTTVAPLSKDLEAALAILDSDPNAVLVSADMASFLKTKPRNTLNVLLARATPQQVDVSLRIAGLYQRLPGFPDGVDAVMSIRTHTEHVPTKMPDFFLADVEDAGDAALANAVRSLQALPNADHIRIDTRATTLDRDQSSLAALNISGLVDLDSAFALAMATATIAIFVFGLLLQRRREYVTLRAQGLEPRTIRSLISGEAVTLAVAGSLAGLVVGGAMGRYFVIVLRPLFVLQPVYTIPIAATVFPVGLVLAASLLTSLVGSRLVNTLQPTELLRDE